MTSLIDINNIDKQLVTEGVLNFTRGDDITSFNLTDDGIIEKYNSSSRKISLYQLDLSNSRNNICLSDNTQSN